MVTDVQEDAEVFSFRSDFLKSGDRYYLNHADGQVIILIADLQTNGRTEGQDVYGMATDSTAEWFGPYGLIYFYEPIEVCKETNAIFDVDTFRKPLKVVPTMLVRIRDGKSEVLLG